MDLRTLLISTANKFPKKEALVTGNGRWTYAALLEKSQRAAAVFRKLGVAKGDRVAVMSFNTEGFVFAAFGAWFAGASLVPINHKLQAPEVKYLVKHADVKIGIVAAELAAIARNGAPETQWLSTEDAVDNMAFFDALVNETAPWEGVDVHEDDEAQVLYTSGTTSQPKGCIHTHRGITTTSLLVSIAIPLVREDRTLIAMPIWHSSPLNNWFLSMMFLGGTAVLLREYHPQQFLQTIQDEKITTFFGAPIAYLAPLQLVKDLHSYDLRSMRAWIYGGGPIGADTARKLMQVYQSDRFYQVYGMSEMGPIGTVLYPDEQIEKAGAIGAVGLPGVDVRVITSAGHEATNDEVGEIWMRADTRMKEYLNNPKETQSVFEDQWYKTGDLARVDADGYMFIVDRLKDVIVTGGENVHSKEVEDVLMAHPYIVEAAVIGRPHKDWGETVTAVVVLKENSDLTLESLRDWMAPKIARYKIPRQLEIRDDLPRTASGKVQKHRLRRPNRPKDFETKRGRA